MTAGIATATATHAAERLDCWCCGSGSDEAQLIRLSRHPQVAVCLRCAHFLHRQARGREALQRPSIGARLRAAIRMCTRPARRRR
jgi:hypothetical protein